MVKTRARLKENGQKGLQPQTLINLLGSLELFKLYQISLKKLKKITLILKYYYSEMTSKSHVSNKLFHFCSSKVSQVPYIALLQSQSFIIFTFFCPKVKQENIRHSNYFFCLATTPTLGVLGN